MCDVTVVIPTWNRWRLLSRAALPAALAQQGVELEIVVVDDGSTDEPPIVWPSSLRARVGSVSSRTGGAGVSPRPATPGSRLPKASGSRSSTTTISGPPKSFAPAARGPRRERRARLLGAIMLDTRLAANRGGATAEPRRSRAHAPLPQPRPGGLLERVATRKLLRRHGGFDEQLYQLADWDLWLRLALDARVACTPEPLVGYSTHPENMVIETRSDVMEELDYLQRKHEALSRAYGVRFDRLWFTRWVAGSNRRAGRRLRASGSTSGPVSSTGAAATSYEPEPCSLAGSCRRSVARLVFSAKARRRASGSRVALVIPSDPDWLHSYRLSASGGPR